MINEILLRRKNRILMDEPIGNSSDRKNSRLVSSLLANIYVLGYTLDRPLIEQLIQTDSSSLIRFYDELESQLRALSGADHTYQPLYPGFPEQLMETTQAELLINALVHYASNGMLYPYTEKKIRPILNWDKEPVILKLADESELIGLGSNLLGSKTSLSDQDYQDLKEILEKYGPQIIPEEIPLKENTAFLAGLLMKQQDLDTLKALIKTPTDLLRMLAAFSDGDQSLAQPVHFKKLKRPQRRLIMDLLAELSKDSSFIEDLFRYREPWIRVGEILHPGEFSNREKYRKVIEAFRLLRDNKKPVTLRTKIYEAIKLGRPLEAAGYLVHRPGEFARNLDKLLRDARSSGPEQDFEAILNLFAGVADQVSAPVLLQMLFHFLEREEQPARIVMPKGPVSQVFTIDKSKIPFTEDETGAITAVLKKALLARFSRKEPMGKVYIDEALSKFSVPFSQRSASSGKKQLVRGSRMAVDLDTKILRAFLWWTNAQNRVDLDLSASVYDNNFQLIDMIAFTNLWDKDPKRGLLHSGDIVNGGPQDGPGVAEFIDIDIDAVKANKGRYVVFQCFSFTGQPFSELPNSAFGWMNRQDMDSGELFEPAAVENLIDLCQPTTRYNPVIFDLEKREFLWSDINIGTEPRTGWQGSFLEANLSETGRLLQALVQMRKPDLYTLASLNAQARAEITKDPAQADLIFALEMPEGVEDRRIITPYDLDVIVSDLL